MNVCSADFEFGMPRMQTKLVAFGVARVRKEVRQTCGLAWGRCSATRSSKQRILHPRDFEKEVSGQEAWKLLGQVG